MDVAFVTGSGNQRPEFWILNRQGGSWTAKQRIEDNSQFKVDGCGDGTLTGARFLQRLRTSQSSTLLLIYLGRGIMLNLDSDKEWDNGQIAVIDGGSPSLGGTYMGRALGFYLPRDQVFLHPFDGSGVLLLRNRAGSMSPVSFLY